MDAPYLVSSETHLGSLGCFKLVGEAFVLGQMDGEGIMGLPEAELKQASVEFTLV